MEPVATIRVPGALAHPASPAEGEEQDLMQCRDFAAQMLSNNMSLLIACKDSVRLDRLGRSMALTLRALPNVRVEGQDIDDTELILERFNQALATMSMSRAMSQRDPAATLTVLVRRHVGIDVPAEWQTLARLAKDFPGAQMLLLLLRASPSLSQEEQNDIFGKQMLRWDANPPYVASKREPVPAAQVALTPDTPLDPGVQPFSSPAEQDLMPLSTDDRGRQSESAFVGRPERKAGPRPLAATVFILMAVMITAAFVVSLIFPRESRALRNLLFSAPEVPVPTSPTPAQPEPAKTDVTKRATPAPVADAAWTGTAVAPKTETEKSSPATLARAVPIAPSAAPETTNAISLKLSSTIEQKTKSAPIARSTPEIAPAKAEAAPNEAKATGAGATAPPVQTRVLAPELTASVQTVRATADSQWFVQFAAFNSYQEAQDWRSGFSLLKQVLIVPVKGKENALFYAVIAGPFATSDDATKFISREGALKTNWLRTAASLKKALLAPAPTKTGGSRG